MARFDRGIRDSPRGLFGAKYAANALLKKIRHVADAIFDLFCAAATQTMALSPRALWEARRRMAVSGWLPEMRRCSMSWFERKAPVSQLPVPRHALLAVRARANITVRVKLRRLRGKPTRIP
jgi:hypothetical protein